MGNARDESSARTGGGVDFGDSFAARGGRISEIARQLRFDEDRHAQDLHTLELVLGSLRVAVIAILLIVGAMMVWFLDQKGYQTAASLVAVLQAIPVTAVAWIRASGRARP